MGKLNFHLQGTAPDNTQGEAAVHPGLLAGMAVNLRWADLEPARGVFDFSPLDRALAAIEAGNRAHPGHAARAKLRVFAGPSAPAWVFDATGGPIEVTAHDRTVPIPHFWTAAYRTAWRGLQNALAAHADADPRLGEVAISSCATVTDEPFIAPLSRDNLPALRQAGYSDAAFRACLAGAADDYAAWRLTPLDFPFNPFRATDGGRPVPEPDFAPRLMEDVRARLGGRVVLSTHGLTASVPPAAQPIYEALRRLGPPIAFQFFAPRTDFDQAVETGAPFRPTELEIWQSREAGGLATESEPQLLAWRNHLACRTP